MKTAKEIAEVIDKAGIYATHAVPDEIDMTGCEEVMSIDSEDHRWYIIETVVYKIGKEFFGVRGIVSLKSESMSYDDTCLFCEAFEMEEVPSVTYVKKTNG